jgi:hypothetical protein
MDPASVLENILILVAVLTFLLGGAIAFDSWLKSRE